MYPRIRDLREDADLTQREVAGMLHCSQQVYSNYELGQRDIPTAVLIALADYYGTTVDYLLGRIDQRGIPVAFRDR
ncbi:MAG: helix-turn-helix transcriptional regulator [Clostridiales bacterium]|nr:helix-turn-helix transcriptional regulator [Clostridiales bacterium]